MIRTLTLFNPATDETRQVRDVSASTDSEIFSAKFDMLCKAGDPWIVVDSAEPEALERDRRYG